MKRAMILAVAMVTVILAVPVGSAEAAPFPEKGKSVTILVPWAAGGSLDLSARLLGSDLEKLLGVPFQVVNRPGASGQVGTTQIAMAKPDGYTIGVTALPSTNTIYLDPDRKAAFGRKDLVPVACHTSDPVAIGVRTDSKYKTVKDLIDDARANPEKIKAGDAGILSVHHLGIELFQKATNVRFANVHFDGGAPGITALVGGHVDVTFDVIGTMASHIRAGKIRILGIMGKEPSRFLPEVQPLQAMGLKIYMSTSRAYSAPAGTPKEIVEVLSGAIKKATEGEEHRKKLADMYTTVVYMDAAQFGAYWDELDAQLKPLVEQIKKK
jgi:tripartite-type tricarboxylate transporter receptor subunit TctC